MEIFERLDEALGYLVEKDGRAQKTIAEAAGVDPSNFSRYLSGSSLPNLQSLGRILVALGRSLRDLADALDLVNQRAKVEGGGDIVPGLTRDELRAEVAAALERLGYRPQDDGGSETKGEERSDRGLLRALEAV